MLRNPTVSELRLLRFLLGNAGSSESLEELLGNLKVSDMDDGGMGSLRLFAADSSSTEREFGKCSSACQFADKDGVDVIASLNVDSNGDLYELDIWKTNFGKLIRIPESSSEFRREQV